MAETWEEFLESVREMRERLGPVASQAPDGTYWADDFMPECELSPEQVEKMIRWYTENIRDKREDDRR